MKTNFKFLKVTLSMLVMVSFLFVSTSCGGDDPPVAQVDHFKEMTDYMKSNSMDLPAMTTDWIITATAVQPNLSDYYILDIRAAADFANGYIPNAVNTTLANVLTEAANNAGKPILIVCYTGQAAGHALCALRLSSYEAKVLKFGMSGWHSDFDLWSANTGNIAVGHTNWSTTNTTQTAVDFTYPEITSTKDTGAEILKERVQAMLDKGFQGINAQDVLDTPSNYFINNWWPAAKVDLYGHIKTSYRVKEDLSLAGGGIKQMDKDATVITYCWTGQTSSVITAYLTVLGFENAKSLKFGANKMIYDALTEKKWPGAAAGFDYETP